MAGFSLERRGGSVAAKRLLRCEEKLRAEATAGMRIYLANVGANASHPFASPLFGDGVFEFLPIPEGERGLDASPHAVRYGDLRSHYDAARGLTRYLPERYAGYACHYDPEFETFTYGDMCDENARASGLRGLGRGDALLFVVRMERWREGRRTKEFGFYLIGGLRVDWMLRGVTEALTGRDAERAAANAHVRKARADGDWNGFWVFGGSPSLSRRFERAVPVNRALCEQVFRDARGDPWQWPSHRSELAVIGSYTRACRCVLDAALPDQAERAETLRAWIVQHSGAEDAAVLDSAE